MDKKGTIIRSFFRFRTGLVMLGVAAVLATLGLWGGSQIEEAVQEKHRESLNTILNADVAALTLWLETQKRTIKGFTCHEAGRVMTLNYLNALPKGMPTRKQLLAHPGLAELKKTVLPAVRAQAFEDFAIIDPSGLVVAAGEDDSIGRRIPAEQTDFVQRALDGEAVVSHPYRDHDGRPVMYTAAPFKDDAGNTRGLIAMRILPERDFTRILTVAQPGKSGETYAFDKDGLMLSRSRFEDQLKKIGLIGRDQNSILNVEIRDPGGNLLEGHPRKDTGGRPPLTYMASLAVEEMDGQYLKGYRDYRGVEVIGAWRWLPDYNFGVTTELDVEEAYSTLYALRSSFWSVFTLLVLSAVGLLYFSWRAHRSGNQARKAEKMGQYTLTEKIGEGGMGQVWKAKHALLRRPTAIKLLRPEDANPEMIVRFEREVQHTAKLTHPNTIAIYDYGRTEDDVFYYAMEYLEGMTLEDVVEKTGFQPEERVIHILRQACGSLQEAHESGLIHRDIKPANIMLLDRAGLLDVVKVLDFGLVKDMEKPDELSLSSPDVIMGTPQYMAPESMQADKEVDHRVDIYALGCVGYVLLTGQEVFEGASLAQICAAHMAEKPIKPSIRANRPISPDLESIIMKCLSKEKEDRPKDARELGRLLRNCEKANQWGWDEASDWQTKHPCRKDTLVRPEQYNVPTVVIEMTDRLEV